MCKRIFNVHCTLIEHIKMIKQAYLNELINSGENKWHSIAIRDVIRDFVQ